MGLLLGLTASTLEFFLRFAAPVMIWLPRPGNLVCWVAPLDSEMYLSAAKYDLMEAGAMFLLVRYEVKNTISFSVGGEENFCPNIVSAFCRCIHVVLYAACVEADM